MSVLKDVDTDTLFRAIPAALKTQNALGQRMWVGSVGFQRILPPRAAGFRTRKQALDACVKEIDKELESRGIIRVGFDVFNWGGGCDE